VRFQFIPMLGGQKYGLRKQAAIMNIHFAPQPL